MSLGLNSEEMQVPVFPIVENSNLFPVPEANLFPTVTKPNLFPVSSGTNEVSLFSVPSETEAILFPTPSTPETILFPTPSTSSTPSTVETILFPTPSTVETVQPEFTSPITLASNVPEISWNIVKKEKLSILAIGDPHYKENNIPEMEEFNLKLLAFINQNKPDIIVLLGDILHKHSDINVYPLQLASKLILELSKILPVYVLIGNHDRPDNSDFMSDFHPFPGLNCEPNITVVSRTTEATIKGHRLVFVPYVSPGNFARALSYIPNPFSDVTAYFAHQEFLGAKMGAFISKIGDAWPETNSLVISGHIHDYDHLQTNIIYTGTPLMHGYGDTSDKTISWFNFDENGSWVETRHNLEITPKRTIYITADQFYTWVPPNGKYIRLNIKGTNAELTGILASQKYIALKNLGIKIITKPIDDKSITPVLSLVANENTPDFQDVQNRFFGGTKSYIEKFQDLLINDADLLKLFNDVLTEEIKNNSNSKITFKIDSNETVATKSDINFNVSDSKSDINFNVSDSVKSDINFVIGTNSTSFAPIVTPSTAANPFATPSITSSVTSPFGTITPKSPFPVSTPVTNSPFGTTTPSTTNSPFGTTTPSTTNFPFGTTTPKSSFGVPTPSTINSPFGTTTPSTTNSPFGTTTPKSPFPVSTTPVTNSPFGVPTPKSPFPVSSTSPFSISTANPFSPFK